VRVNFPLSLPPQRREILMDFMIDYNKESELQNLKPALEYPLFSF
jgi:hypothetical protein